MPHRVTLLGNQTAPAGGFLLAQSENFCNERGKPLPRSSLLASWMEVHPRSPPPAQWGSLIPSLCAPEGRRNGSATKKEILSGQPFQPLTRKGELRCTQGKVSFFVRRLTTIVVFMGQKKLQRSPNFFLYIIQYRRKRENRPKRCSFYAIFNYMGCLQYLVP